MKKNCLLATVLIALLGTCCALNAQESATVKAEAAFNKAVATGPLATRAFLDQFPKGADLHVHLSGAIYAESFIAAAAEDGLCVDPDALAFVKPPCVGKLVEAKTLAGNISGASQVLYDKLLDSFSMRAYVPYAGWNGHDQFFATFARFSGLDKKHQAEFVNEVASRAADQNQYYLELMNTPSFGTAIKLAATAPKLDEEHPDFAGLRDYLLKNGLQADVATDRAEAKEVHEGFKKLAKCGTAEAGAQCNVEIRYIYQVLRNFSPEQVFAQTLLGFETVTESQTAGSKDWVAINFVMPEDAMICMRDHKLQTEMVGYLHTLYPKVHITLHAGELALGLVTPEGLKSHIREAVEIAHAERIGHGVDVMYEKDALGLLKEMAEKHVMVEVNLSSNDGILGIKGEEHPLHSYLAAHVPVNLNTDDEGVSRIDITNEYVRAAREQKISYAELKNLSRTGLEHNFLDGASLWAEQDKFTKFAGACAGANVAKVATGKCKEFLDVNEKAATQWKLEQRFAEFEGKF